MEIENELMISQKRAQPGFDYSSIPEGYYQHVVESGSPIRKAWHLQKFERILECLPPRQGQSILDIGCFAGTFLSLLPGDIFNQQWGVDILEGQIKYAQERFGTSFRRFQYLKSIHQLNEICETFDCITLIEVIEHLSEVEISELFSQIVRKLKPGGKLVISTPNYTSAWPFVEILVNLLSDVSYEEQHITKFNFFTCLKKLHRLSPMLFSHLKLDFKTTTHFLAPFLAGIHFNAAMRISRAVPHRDWKNPFGNLILLSFTKL